MDYLKNISSKLGGKIRSQNLNNYNINKNSFRAATVKHRGYKLVIDEFGANFFMISIYVESDFSFSINNIDKLFHYNTLTSIKNFPYNIYASKENADPFLVKEFGQLVSNFILSLTFINLSNNESIFIYRNCLCFALESNRDLIPIIDNVIGLIDDNTEIFKKDVRIKIFRKNIPDDLKPLVPLMKKWSISDDKDRDQLIEETSEKEKRKLLKTVSPYIESINSFLNSFGDKPLTNEAILLGNLAELVSELNLEF